MDPVSVLIVDDSAFARDGLRALLATDDRVRIVGEASDGEQAVRMVQSLRPQVITMDINMPVMDGYEAIKRIMSSTPTPILVLSSVQESTLAFKAISLGALEVMEKPRLSDSSRDQLVSRLLFLSRVKVIRHVRESFGGSGVNGGSGVLSAKAPVAKNPEVQTFQASLDDNSPSHAVPGVPASCVVGIASSTGGPKALATVLGSLPGDLAAAVVVAQHIGPGFSAALAAWLGHVSPLRVVVAQEGMRLEQSVVYIAPDRKHVSIHSSGKVELAEPGQRDMYIPSADTLLSSVASFAKTRAIAVVLTGMGRDGSVGSAAVRSERGWNIAQDEASSIVFGMPAAAIATGCVDVVVALDRVASEIVHQVLAVAR